jgi:hypothetical protein
LVDPTNIEEAVAMLARGLFDADLRRYLIDRGLKNAERFSWTDAAREVTHVYEHLF